MKCIACGKETKLMNGDGEAYCKECMRVRRIKDPKTYSSSCGGFIDTREDWIKRQNK